LTVIEPSFDIDPWYANSPVDSDVQYETFMTTQLEPWVKATLSTTGQEQSWLIGFSKSGLGAQDLLLKHPNLFTLAASWDFPAGMATFNALGDSTHGYGTDANFQVNYRLTPAFLEAHRAPFQHSNRIWIGSYSLYGPDVAAYNALLTSADILHSAENPTPMPHTWDGGWVPIALSALYKDSLEQD
jgi:S-formylglutathione hydrolase FrmB